MKGRFAKRIAETSELTKNMASMAGLAIMLSLWCKLCVCDFSYGGHDLSGFGHHGFDDGGYEDFSHSFGGGSNHLSGFSEFDSHNGHGFGESGFGSDLGEFGSLSSHLDLGHSSFGEDYYKKSR